MAEPRTVRTPPIGPFIMEPRADGVIGGRWIGDNHTLVVGTDTQDFVTWTEQYSFGVTLENSDQHIMFPVTGLYLCVLQAYVEVQVQDPGTDHLQTDIFDFDDLNNLVDSCDVSSFNYMHATSVLYKTAGDHLLVAVRMGAAGVAVGDSVLIQPRASITKFG